MPRKANETKKKEVKETKEKTIDIKAIEIELKGYLEDRKEDITKEITTKIDEQIEVKVTKRLKEEEKKLNRGKTGKIITRDIIIILLLAVIGYFGYCLYDIDYFNIRTKVVDKNNNNQKDNQTSDKNNNNQEDENKEPVVDNKPDSSYYIKNYSYLIDNLLIEDESVFNLFSKQTTKENISNELILKIAYKNLDKLNITNENNMITFHKDSLLESAKKIFGETITLKNEMFTYNNTKFMYYNETYLGLKEDSNKVNIITKVTDAKEEEGKLTFEFIVCKISSENQLLDIENNIILDEYNNEDIEKYQEHFNKNKITFEKINDIYIFESITLT